MTRTVTVVGAGVLGLTVALRLAQCGFRPVVHDPAPLGDNASGVAAGMLAPVFECLLDGDPAHLDLLRAARDLWPSLAQEIGGADLIDRSGALWVGEEPGGGGSAGLLRALTGEAARTRQPALAGAVERAWFTDEDWGCAASPMLARLRAAALDAGARFRAEAWRPGEGRDTPVVVAAGCGGRALSAAAPELARLMPVKGQLVRFQGGPESGAIVRGPGVYMAPGAGGAVVGASMEVGIDDRRIDPAITGRLIAAASALVDGLEDGLHQAQAAVRAATPDGLPLVGPSSRPGVLLAVGARRNGWLLAPLVAAVVASYLRGEHAGPFAAALDPRRFDHAP